MTPKRPELATAANNAATGRGMRWLTHNSGLCGKECVRWTAKKGEKSKTVQLWPIEAVFYLLSYGIDRHAAP